MLNEVQTPIYESIYLPEYQEVLIFSSYSPGDYTVSHWHEAIEIIYLHQGDLSITIGDQDYQLTDDTFLVINSKAIHSTKCVQENYALVIQIPQNFLKHNLPEIDQLMFQITVPEKQSPENQRLLPLKQILREMYGQELMQGDGCKLKITSLLYDLLYLLYRDFRIELPRIEFLKHTKNLSILSEIMKYSEQNHASDISLAVIAQVAGFQTKYFCRFFKNNVGCTYLFYLNQLRIQYIYEDLLHTDTPIYQLLEKHGFTNYKLFRKMFYDRFHTTPRTIRKNE
jgi:AraC-like DNA-binding protein